MIFYRSVEEGEQQLPVRKNTGEVGFEMYANNDSHCKLFNEWK